MIKIFLSFFAPTYLKKLVEQAKLKYESSYQYYSEELIRFENRVNKVRNEAITEENYLERVEKLKRDQAFIDKAYSDLAKEQEIFSKTKKAEMSSITEELKAQKSVIVEKDSVIKNLRETIDKLIKTVEVPKLSVVK